MAKHPVEIVYRIIRLEISGPNVEMVLQKESDLPEEESSSPALTEEEAKAAHALDASPPPRTDTDRVMEEMMDSIKKYAPAAYEQLRVPLARGAPVEPPFSIAPANTAFVQLIPRKIYQEFTVSMEQYMALGSPPLMSKIRFRLQEVR